VAESDVIDRGSSDIDFRGLQDGTLNLILRNRFEEEISTFVPDLREDFQKKITSLAADKCAASPWEKPTARQVEPTALTPPSLSFRPRLPL
jgi:hypothetical protein